MLIKLVLLNAYSLVCNSWGGCVCVGGALFQILVSGIGLNNLNPTPTKPRSLGNREGSREESGKHSSITGRMGDIDAR